MGLIGEGESEYQRSHPEPVVVRPWQLEFAREPVRTPTSDELCEVMAASGVPKVGAYFMSSRGVFDTAQRKRRKAWAERRCESIYWKYGDQEEAIDLTYFDSVWPIEVIWPEQPDDDSHYRLGVYYLLNESGVRCVDHNQRGGLRLEWVIKTYIPQPAGAWFGMTGLSRSHWFKDFDLDRSTAARIAFRVHSGRFEGPLEDGSLRLVDLGR